MPRFFALYTVRRIVLIVTIVFAALLLSGLVAGREVTEFLDRWITTRAETFPNLAAQCNVSDIVIAGYSLPMAGIDNLPRHIDVHFTQANLKSWRSLIGWREPLRINVFGGPSPAWGRYVYFQIDSGTIMMRWRLEQQYYRNTGWTKPVMQWNSHNGLIAFKNSEQEKQWD
jgi:hypothetical protein